VTQIRNIYLIGLSYDNISHVLFDVDLGAYVAKFGSLLDLAVEVEKNLCSKEKFMQYKKLAHICFQKLF